MIDSAVAGAAPFLPVRLVVFPEFAHAAPVFPTVAELIEKLAIQIPNEHTERLQQKAKEHDIYIQSGSMLEVDPKWPGHVFNTTCLIGPQGVLYKYRKVNTWIPYEVHTSPHDLPDYDEPLLSGRRHAYRPRLRDLLRLVVSRSDEAVGGEWRGGVDTRVGLHGSVGRNRADGVVDGGESLSRTGEHCLCGSRKPGRESQALSALLVARWKSGVDLTGDARGSITGPGERIVVAPVDISALRHERATRRGHHMLAHLRTEAYPVYQKHQYLQSTTELSYEKNNLLIDEAKRKLED